MLAFVTVSLRFQAQGVATIQPCLCLPLPNVSVEMQPVDTSPSAFPSEPLSVPLEERHLLHYFSPPQTIHVGGLENKTERVGGPRRIEANIKDVC